MKRNRTLIAGLVLAAGISGVAIAQGGRGYGCDGSGPMAGMGPMGPMGRHAAMKFDPAQMSQRVEERLDYMKYQLKITAAQEPLWNAYADKMKAEAEKGMKDMQAMRTSPADDKLSAPERMAQRQTLMEQRLAAMKGVHESFDRLYGALTPEQKATADKLAGRMGKGGMGGGMRGGMMPRG
jgi:hypothetical protein